MMMRNMNTILKVLGISIILATTIVSVDVWMSKEYGYNQQQSYWRQTAYAQVAKEVMNSKYLEVIDHKYCSACKSIEFEGKNLGMVDTVTGTIKNINAEEVLLDDIYALLYDKNNKLITVETGRLDPSYSLASGEQAKFEIEMLYSNDPIRADFDHYVIVPSGTA